MNLKIRMSKNFMFYNFNCSSYFKKVCTINFITRVNPKLGKEGVDYKIIYTFDKTEQEENSITINSASSYPDGFIVNVDEVESYINLSELYAYEIPKKYSIDEFEKAYKNDEIDPEEDLEAVDFRVIKKERWKI